MNGPGVDTDTYALSIDASHDLSPFRATSAEDDNRTAMLRLTADSAS